MDVTTGQNHTTNGINKTKKKTVERILRCEIMNVNRPVANNLLKSCMFPRQRQPAQMQIDRYVAEQKRGFWIPGSPLYFAVLPNGTMFLLNGQHSLNAVVQSNTIQQFTAIYCGVKDIEEAGHLYSRFDIHRRRSWGDAYRAAGFSEKFNIDRAWIGYLGSSIRLIATNFNPSIREFSDILYSREIQLRIFEDYVPHAEAYIASLAHRHGKRSMIWRRSSVMSVGMELFKHQPKKAEQFFFAASNDDGLAKLDPRKRLLEFLQYNPGMASETRRYTCYAVMLAWNAFWRGETEMIRIPANTVSKFRLMGTPWKSDDYRPFDALIGSFVARSAATVKYNEITTGEMMTGSGERVPMSQYTGDKALLPA